MSYNKPSFIIASPFSGSGKTTLSLGLMAALTKRGYIVQPFKVGPDYIDPLFHKTICRRPSYNLDTWMMGVEGVKRQFFKAINSADIGIVEGVMGLFDGKEGGHGEGSTAHIAKVLNLPILLIIDGSKMAQSVAPLLYGYETFDPDLNILGVVFNKVGSKRHYEILKSSVEGRSNAKVLGFIPKEEEVAIPERHLGLETGFIGDSLRFKRFIKKLTILIEENIDVNGILKGWKIERLEDFRDHPSNLLTTKPSNLSPPTTRIAVAMDEAFSFYYEENLDILKECGAELIPFSPLKDKNLPKGIGGIYIGGGYPEVYGERLESNIRMREEIKGLAERGFPIYAECGGLMYLGKDLKGVDGKVYNMVGIFPWRSRMLSKRKRLGYIEVETIDGLPFIEEGRRIRGHEFHYSEMEVEEGMDAIKRVYRVIDPPSSSSPLEGYLYRHTLASYIHLHFSSNPDLAKGFVKAASFFLDNR